MEAMITISENDILPVELMSSWAELFNTTTMDSKMRRERWQEWRRIAIQEQDGEEIVRIWSTPSEVCHNCDNRDYDWCNHVGLPCTVNPVLTFQENLIGLACMGVGFEEKENK